MSKGTAARLRIKVVPGSSRSGLAGWLGDTLKVRVTAVAEKGRANAAVESVLAGALGVPDHAVLIVSGKTSSRKTVEVRGLTPEEIHALLGDARRID